MTSRRKLLRLQRKWAQSAQLEPDVHGYLAGVEKNLWKPFSPSTLADFQKGSGAELQPGRTRPAKMHALHSSAILAVNVFDHWVDRNPSPLMHALCIESEIKSVSFEAQVPTGLAGNPPNVDVALELASGSVVAIESKFSEWLVPKRKSRTPFKDKYFDGGKELWTRKGLPKCQALAGQLKNGGEGFRFLDAPQLLKHTLGLATNRRGRFALYYMYYDFACPASEVHREEVKRFADCVDSEIHFKAVQYQELFRTLRERTDVDPEYLAYLGVRYFASAEPG